MICRSFSCVCAATALALSLGCGENAGDVALRRAALPQEKSWITAAPDAVELLARVLGERPLPREIGDARSDAVALLVPSDALVALSELEHEERGRCGGYMLHESEQEALAALRRDPPSEPAFFLAPDYTLDNAATVTALMAEVKEPNVLATIRKLSSFRNRFHTSMTGLEASNWIRDTWRMIAMGRDDISVALVDHDKTPQPSIALTIRGREAADEIVVLGGHMDSISGRGGNNVTAPGADDNASGIAVLTEILRAAVELGYRPRRTVTFYGYAAEEVGLIGSAEIAAQAAKDKLNVVGVMQLDMTNFTSAAAPYITLIRDNTDAALNQFSINLIETYLKMPWKYYDCGYACSDHASWTQNKFPSTFPHEAQLKEGNQRIHTEGDTLALSKDSAAHAMHFARFGVAFLAELGKGELMTNDGACSASKPCGAGERCEAGTCVATIREPVGADGLTGCSAACAADATCQDGECVPKADRSADGGSSRRADAGRVGASADAGRASAARDASRDLDEGDDEGDDDDEPQEQSETAAREGGCAVHDASHKEQLVLWGGLIASLAWRRRARRGSRRES